MPACQAPPLHDTVAHVQRHLSRLLLILALLGLTGVGACIVKTGPGHRRSHVTQKHKKHKQAKKPKKHKKHKKHKKGKGWR